MSAVGCVERRQVLPAELSSAGLARRLVAGVLADLDGDGTGTGDVADTAALLVSEVVTNAVLHAGTEITLCCRASSSGWVRVEVHDGSPVLPAVRHYGEEASTGRGLALVEHLATLWGAELDAAGKTLWFELGSGGPGRPAPPASPAAPPRPFFTVHLLGAPPALMAAAIEHGDAVLREAALLAMAGELDGPGELDEAASLAQPTCRMDVSPLLEVVEAAMGESHDTAELVVLLAPEAATGSAQRLAQVEAADGLARQGRLLAPHALPEITACRHWMYSQITDQADGAAPSPWQLPDPTAAVATASPDDAELARLDAAPAAVVVADRDNRIVYANAAAAALLGWEPPESLVGQRLTVIIPPELRQAHLAGFTRVQLGGAPHVLGLPVRLPALRRDGTRVEVELLIERAPEAGRGAFRAELRPVDGPPAPGA